MTMQAKEMQGLVDKLSSRDAQIVRDARGTVRELRDAGLVRPRQYGLTPPFTTRQSGKMKACWPK